MLLKNDFEKLLFRFTESSKDSETVSYTLQLPVMLTCDTTRIYNENWETDSGTKLSAELQTFLVFYQ